MSESNTPHPVVDLVNMARGRKFEAFEEALSGYLEGPNPSPGALAEAFAAFGKSKDVLDDIEPLLWLTANVLDEKHGAAAALAAIERLATTLPDSPTLRQEARRLVEKLHSDYHGVAAMAEQAIGRDTPLDASLAELRHYLEFVPGIYIYEKTRARVGRLDTYDPERQMFKIDYGGTHEYYKPVSLDKLVALDGDDFRALALFDPERLREMAQQNPVRMVELLLKSARDDEMKSRDIKAALEPFLPPKAWTSWWKALKPQLRRSPIIEVGEGSQPTLRRRATPLSAEEQFRRETIGVDEPLERLALVLARSREWEAGSEHDAPLAAQAEAILADTEATLPAGAADLHLALRGVRDELAQRFPEAASAPEPPSTAWIDAIIAEPQSFLPNCSDEALTQAALGYMARQGGPRAAEALTALLPFSAVTTCEWIARALSERGEAARLAEAFAVMHRRPTQCIDALVWAWKSADAGRWNELLAESSLEELLLTVLSLAARLGRGDATGTRRQHTKLPPLRNALAAGHFGLVDRVVKEATAGEAQHIYDVSNNNSGLGEVVESSIRHILQRRHPELFREDVPPWADGNIYTTSEGLTKRQAELNELIKVKIADNQKKLSHARSFGDLSENAEYDAAKEEAGQLAKLADRMRDELQRAQVIHGPQQPAGVAGIGVTVKARRTDTGEVETYTFLGPWDADHQRYVYSYLAPLSLEFMGKKAGDTVRYGQGRDERAWTIVDVTAAL